MFMRVTVTANPRTNLAIPEAAVQPIGPKTYVWRVSAEDGTQKARRVEVELGQRADGYIEILSGLASGDQVITEGIIRVREGSELRLHDRSLLAPAGSLAGGGRFSG